MHVKRWMGLSEKALVGVALLFAAATAPSQAQTLMRVRPSAQSSVMQQDSSGCAPSRKSSGLCFGAPQFLTYTAAAYACSQYGGRLPTLGELVAYRFGPGSAETGIDCSSDWDAGAGTLWCVGNKGAISGVGLQNQAEALSKLPAEFRCVTYLKQ